MSETILIIEDNSEMQDLLKLLLEQEGYRILSATSGNEAIEKLRYKPELMLVLLDLTLPDMGSETFLHIVRSERLAEKVPIVFFSAVPRLKQMELPPGVAGVIQKPFQIQELLDLIGSYREKVPVFQVKNRQELTGSMNDVR